MKKTDVLNKKMFKNFNAVETKVADGAPRTLVVKISTPTPDRSKDTVQPDGMNADNFMKNPVVMFAHNYSDMPIAKCTGLKVTDSGILATVQFPDEGVYAKADTIYQMYKQGYLNAWSIGFMPTDYDENLEGGYNFKSWELFEFSSVPVPDNPEALTVMRSKGIDVDAVLEEKIDERAEELKAVVGEIIKSTSGFEELISKLAEVSKIEPEKKDVSQVVALGYLLDELSYFIRTFTQMGVKQENIDMLTQALALVMSVVKDQAVVGEKTMQLPVTMKSGRTISSKHEKMLKAACEHMQNGMDAVNGVLESIAEQEDDSKEDGDKNVSVSYVKRLASSLKQSDKSIGLTLRLLKTIEMGTEVKK